MAKQAGAFDMILETVSAVHDIHPYLHALKRDGNLTLGVRAHLGEQDPLRISHRRHPAQPGDARLLREHGITADVEVIPIQKVNEAYERLLGSDVSFSSDMASLKAE